MPMYDPGRAARPNAARRGLFGPDCASCGRDDLRTVSGKHTSANAGYCPSCGVFVCFTCAGKAGFLDWKRTCPSCGSRLRTNTALFFTIWTSIYILIVGAFVFPLGVESRFVYVLLLLLVFILSLSAWLGRYRSHRRTAEAFGSELRSRPGGKKEPAVAYREATLPAGTTVTVPAGPGGGSTVEELERRYGSGP